MTKLKPCNGMCLEEDGYSQPCFLKAVGLCALCDKSDIDTRKKGVENETSKQMS